MNWKVTALGTIALSIGAITGCQTVPAANQIQTVLVNHTNNTLATTANKANNAVTNTTGNPDSIPTSLEAKSPDGPTPINIQDTSSLQFTGTPTATSSSATSAATPSFVDGHTGYAALNGDVIKTVDGGQTWSVVGHVDGDIQNIAFSNLSDGLVAVQNGGEITNATQTTTQYTWAIYRTTDGGRTWTEVWTASVNEPQTTYMSGDFHFSMFGETGYAVLANHLLATRDGGQTWQPIAVSGQVGDAVATSRNNLWVVTSAAQQSKSGSAQQGNVKLLHSTDCGRHFQLVLETAPMLLWETKLAFGSSGNGILLVKDLGNWATTAYWTSDSGNTWKHGTPQAFAGRIAQSEPAFGSSGVAYIGLDPGAAPFAGGVTTFDVKTGKTSRISQNGDWRNAQIGAVKGQVIYATASLNEGGEALFRSTDSGKNWRQVYPAGVPNRQVHFVSPSVGYGLGMNETSGYIYKTTDGGQTWTTLDTLQGMFPSAIAFVNSETAYVSTYVSNGDSQSGTGYHVQLLVTHDAGVSWRPVAGAQIPTAATKGIDMPSMQAGLSASKSGISMVIDSAYPMVVLSSQDTKTWAQVAAFKSALGIDAIAYASPNDLWISSVSQNHVPAENHPSVYTSTIYQVGGMGQTKGAQKPLWTLPKGWTVLGMARPSVQDAYVYAIKSLDTKLGSAMFVTHNGGKTWTEYVGRGVSAAKSNVGAAVVDGKASSNQAPEPLNLFPSGAVINLSFVNANDGYMLTANGLLKTTDGGARWMYVG